MCDRLEREYDIKNKILKVVIEVFKQWLVAIAFGFYQGRLGRYRQNRVFQNNQMQIHTELNQERERLQMRSLMLKNRKFWESIWDQSSEQNARWFKYLRKEIDMQKKVKIDIITEKFEENNWQNVKLGVTRVRYSPRSLVKEVKQFPLDNKFTTKWRNKVIIIKQIITVIIADKIYGHFDRRYSSLEGDTKRSCGTDDLSPKEKNLAMVWIDFRQLDCRIWVRKLENHL